MNDFENPLSKYPGLSQKIKREYISPQYSYKYHFNNDPTNEIKEDISHIISYYDFFEKYIKRNTEELDENILNKGNSTDLGYKEIEKYYNSLPEGIQGKIDSIIEKIKTPYPNDKTLKSIVFKENVIFYKKIYDFTKRFKNIKDYNKNFNKKNNEEKYKIIDEYIGKIELSMETTYNHPNQFIVNQNMMNFKNNLKAIEYSILINATDYFGDNEKCREIESILRVDDKDSKEKMKRITADRRKQHLNRFINYENI